jgi:hypothetical protein
LAETKALAARRVLKEMTFTAQMAGIIARHRILAYALATLALVAFLVMGFSPANAAGLTIQQPSETLKNAAGNCSYLTFCRWNDLSQTGQPPIIGMPQLFISNLLFMFGQFAFFIVGQAYIFVENLDIYYSLLYFGDSVFAKMSVVSPNGGLQISSLIGTIIFAGIVVAALMMLPAISRKFSGTGMTPAKTIMWVIGGIVILSVMSTASAKNHNGTSPIAQVANNEAENSIKADSVGDAAKKPANWQPYSLGWAVAWGNTMAGYVGNLAVNALSSVTGAMDVKATTQTSSCDIYIDSMHDLYKGDGATSVNGGVLGVERLYRAAVLDQYVTSNFGSSRGAQDAWCRTLEITKPVNEQVIIANNAKNTAGHALYKPALDVMVDGNLNWINKDKESLKGNPRFKDENFGAGLAVSFFAPVYGPIADNFRASYNTYFAMCLPENGTIKLNPEWAGVIQVDKDKPMSELVSPDGQRSICTAMANGDTKDLKTDSNQSIAVGFMKEATDSVGGVMTDGKTDYMKVTKFSGGSDNTNIVELLFNGGGSNKAMNFVSAAGGISGPAYSYYAISTGILWGGGFLSACIMMFVTYLIIRIAFPVVLGGAAAQFFSAAAMMIISFTLFAMIVWPSRKMRGLNIKTFAVVVAGSLVSTVFTAVFLLYAGLFSFVNSVLSIRQGLSDTGPQVVENVANGVSLLLAGLISYSLMKIILSKTLNFDPTNMKTALSSSANAVMSPLTKGNKGFKDTMASPFRSALDLVKTPVEDTKSQWSGLRDSRDKMLDKTSDILGKRSNAAKTASANSPQGATSTANNGGTVATAGPGKDGTSTDPLIGIILDPKNAGMGAGAAGAAGTGGVNPAFGAAAGAGVSSLTDEQHRQRLMDQLKSAYGTAQAEKVFPNGIPGDYASMIAKAPLDEVKRLSKMLDSRVEGSDAPRASSEQAAANMKKFAAMGEETLKMNPNGFDQSVGYAERAATQAQMFRGVNPLSDKDFENMSESDKRNFDSRKFDLVGDAIPNGRSVSFGNGADVIKGEVVPDPLTARNVPNAIVRSGSQNLAPIEGVTQDGTSLFGAKRSTNPDGTPSENWGLATLDSGSRQLPPTMFSGSVPPAGVTPDQWNEVNDLHSWIKDHDLKMDSTAMSSWPLERRQQAGRVADVMGNVMSSQGVPMVQPEKLESLADSGIGVTSADDSFTFGEKVPDSTFNATGMRDAISTGRERLDALREKSAQRAELMVGNKVKDQLEVAEASIRTQEKALEEKLSERTSLVKGRAESHLAGLLASLEQSNADEAREISGLLDQDKWDEIAEVLNGSSGSDDDADELREQIRGIVDHSKSRIQSLNSDHQSNVAQLYAQLAEERESITEQMHRDIESELQTDIERNTDGVRELAFAGVSDTSRKHVEGMLGWFPAIKSRFFSGNDVGPVDPEDMEDADGDGIDDRLQVNV